MSAAEPAARRMNVISCGGGGTGCHIEPTPDGILNTAIAKKAANPEFVCVKCHIANGRLPVPESHAAAVNAATKK